MGEIGRGQAPHKPALLVTPCLKPAASHLTIKKTVYDFLYFLKQAKDSTGRDMWL